MWLPIRRFLLINDLAIQQPLKGDFTHEELSQKFLFSGSYYSRRESMCVIHLKSKVKTKKL